MTNIYFLQNNDTVKIGRSKDVQKRVGELQTGNHNSLKLIYVIEDVSESFEKYVHDVCFKYHVNGEWFGIDAVHHLLAHPWFCEHMKAQKEVPQRSETWFDT